MVPPGEGNDAGGDGRRGVGVSQSTAEAGELSPRDPVEGRGPRQVAPVEGKTANTPRVGPVSTSRHRIAELARQALGMAVAIAWLPGPAGTRRRVAKLSVEEAGCGRTRTSGSVGGQGQQRPWSTRPTNAIENLNGGITTYSRNVKRWRSGTMVVRWVSAAIVDAEKKFRRVHGWREITTLVSALGDLEAKEEASTERVV